MKVAGVLKAPPKMVEGITKWAIATVATEALRQVGNKRAGLEKETIDATNGPFAISLQDALLLQQETEEELNSVVKLAKRLGGREPASKTPPRDYSTEYPLDLRGWDHQKFVEQSLAKRRLEDPTSLWMFDQTYDPITVVFYPRLKRKGMPLAEATWNHGFFTLWGIPPYLHREKQLKKYLARLRLVIRHELQHLSQDLLREASGIGSAGRKKDTKVEGLPSGEHHALQGVEFFTRLQDDIDTFREEILPLANDQMEAMKSFVGSGPPVANIHVSEFFGALKKYDKAKWRRAVSEFVKALSPQEKTAARPIPLDRASLEKALEGLYHQAEIYLKEAPEGVPLQESYQRLGQRRMVVKTVWGEERELSVYLTVVKKPPRKEYQVAHFGPHSSLVPLTGGNFKSKGETYTLEIQVNGAVYPEEILGLSNWSLFEDRIKSILLHEVTHAMDYLQSKSPYVTAEEDYAKYVNQPAEIRAHLQEIIEDAKRSGKSKSSPRFRKMFDVNTRQDQVRAVLKGNTVWNRIERHLTPKNRQIILKAVYRALEPFLEDLPVGRVPSAKRVIARYLEAREDARLIAEADKILKKVQQLLGSEDSRRNNLRWDSSTKRMYLLGSKVGLPGLIIGFGDNDTGSYHGENANGDSIIVIGLKGLGYRLDKVHTISEALQKYRRVILHELVHYLDRKRIGQKGWEETSKNYPEPEEDPKGYYNHPTELNAYFMEALGTLTEKYTEAMSHINPSRNDNDHQTAVWELDEWMEEYGKDFRVFQKEFWRTLNRRATQYLTDQNKRRFGKRLYDWWSKASRSAKDMFKDLLHRGDETALSMSRTASYYSLRFGTPIREVIQRWVEQGDKVDENSMPHYVPPRELLPYREYIWTRDKARDGNARVDGKRVWLPGPLKWDAMVADLKKSGWDIKEPLHLQIGKDGTTKVGEGNHRLAIALEVGLPNVPVYFHFQQKVQKSRPEPEPVPNLPSRTVEKTVEKMPPMDEKTQKQVDDLMKLLGY